MAKLSVQNRPKTKCQRGAGMLEYVLMLSLIAMIGMASVQALGTSLSNSFDKSGRAVAGGGVIECAAGNPGWPACLSN